MKTRNHHLDLILFIVAGLLRPTPPLRGAGRGYVKVVPMQFVDVGTPEATHWIDYDVRRRRPPGRGPAIRRFRPTMRMSWTQYQAADYRAVLEADMTDPGQTAYQFSLVADDRHLGRGVLHALHLLVPLHATTRSTRSPSRSSSACRRPTGWSSASGTRSCPTCSASSAPDLGQELGDAAASSRSWQTGVDSTSSRSSSASCCSGASRPKGGWIARWPLAFIIGVFCGLRLVDVPPRRLPEPDPQPHRAPLRVAMPAAPSTSGTRCKNVILVVGVLSCLVYFFFSIEHKGVVGKTAKLGIWFLMITFGAGVRLHGHGPHRAARDPARVPLRRLAVADRSHRTAIGRGGRRCSGLRSPCWA